MKVITIGRHTDNQIVINDEKVSRTHLQIVQDDDGNFSVVDFNSTNGTFINGKRITGEVAINKKDKIRIGSTTLPWKSYFVSTDNADTPVQETPVPNKPSSASRKTWVIAAVIAGVLLLCGGVAWYIINLQEKHKQELVAKEKEKENAIEELKSQQAIVDNLTEEYDKAKNELFDAEKTNDEKKINEAKQNLEKRAIELANADKELKSKQQVIETLTKEKESLENEKKTLNDDIKNKDAAIVEKNNQLTEKDDELKKTKAEADENKKAAELSIAFYKDFNQLSSKNFNKVCEQLYNTTTNAKTRIEQEFEKADNNGKEKIIQTVKQVLAGQQTDIEKATETFNDNVKNLTINGINYVYTNAFSGVVPPADIANAKTDLTTKFKNEDGDRKIEIAKIVVTAVEEQKQQPETLPTVQSDNQ
jgi:pSer/pThr/pTyr-binding forkhead associated (FHA) protein